MSQLHTDLSTDWKVLFGAIGPQILEMALTGEDINGLVLLEWDSGQIQRILAIRSLKYGAVLYRPNASVIVEFIHTN